MEETKTVTKNEFHILTLLKNASENLYPWQMNEISEGDLKQGTLYNTLQRMEEKKGLVTSEKKFTECGVKRRMYSITAEGLDAVDRFQNEMINLLVQGLPATEAKKLRDIFAEQGGNDSEPEMPHNEPPSP